MLSDRCLSVCLSVLSVTMVYCGQTVRWIRMQPVTEVRLGSGDIVLDRDPTPHPKKGWGNSPQFLACVCYSQMSGWIKMPVGTAVGLGPCHTVLDRDPAPPKNRVGHSSPHFSAHVYCGPTVGRIKIPLGMEIGLGPGYIMLDGDTAPLTKRDTTDPSFRSTSIVAKWLN